MSLMSKIRLLLLCAVCLAGCAPGRVSSPEGESAEPAISTATTRPEPTPTSALAAYAFPEEIDPRAHYLFYLHGKIIEDQGLPAISPEYGEYQYLAILEKLQSYDYVVISEQRAAETDVVEYASRVAGQVTLLLVEGIKPEYINIVGASKGAIIAAYASHFLANSRINFVLLAGCHPDTVKELIQNDIHLYGNVLSIYDSSDVLAGSCQELFTFSEGKGISDHEELVLEVGTGHGILYQPLKEWTLPTAEWGRAH